MQSLMMSQWLILVLKIHIVFILVENVNILAISSIIHFLMVQIIVLGHQGLQILYTRNADITQAP